MARTWMKDWICLLVAIPVVHFYLPSTSAAAVSPTSHLLNSSDTSHVASKSVLAALLESPHSEMMELVEQAGMLQPLESAVGQHNVTIFAPKNEFLEQHLDSEFKKFLLEPGNLRLLQRVLLFHVIPHKIAASQWKNGSLQSLSKDDIHLHWNKKELAVEHLAVDSPDMIVRDDGVVHGISGLLVPKSVEDAYAAMRMKNLPSAVFPEGAPQLREAASSLLESKPEPKLFHVTLPATLADLDIGSAPAPSPSSDPFSVDGDGRIADFITSLVQYGGYNEIAELLVNLTSLASEMGKLVKEGHRLTILVPNDHAINLLTTEQLNAPGGIESILTYHIIPEYQTEESLYSLAKRHEKVMYSTLRVPFKLTAQEIDGTVQFGNGKSSGLLLDPNIYTDGRISVQGINNLLIPLDSVVSAHKPHKSSAPVSSTHAPAPRKGLR